MRVWWSDVINMHPYSVEWIQMLSLKILFLFRWEIYLLWILNLFTGGWSTLIDNLFEYIFLVFAPLSKEGFRWWLDSSTPQLSATSLENLFIKFYCPTLVWLFGFKLLTDKSLGIWNDLFRPGLKVSSFGTTSSSSQCR